jgi:acetate kinase
MTVQSGLPHNNRVGDFDGFAIIRLLKHGIELNEIFRRLAKEGGLLGMSGLSPDMRDIERAAAAGNARAKLTIDAFVESARHYIGSFLVVLGGCDVLVFTGGMGENAITLRAAICKDLDFAGLILDSGKNQTRAQETCISKVESNGQIWVIPTNEELIVALETESVLNTN